MSFVGSAIAAAITFVGIVIVDKVTEKRIARREKEIFGIIVRREFNKESVTID